MRKSWAVLGLAVLGFSVSLAHAAEWVKVSEISNNSREVDKSSIQGTKPKLTFTSRHMIEDSKEFKIGREAVKYIVLKQTMDCDKRTTLVLTSEAQRADSSLISRQNLLHQQETAVLANSVDEDILKFVCAAPQGK